MNLRRLSRYALWSSLIGATLVLGHPFPGYWNGGAGGAIHFQPVQWPNEPSAAACGDSCGDWKPYTRFGRGVDDPRVQDPSNGGTAPQNYVNVSSSCSDKSKPSIYYYLYKASNPANDVVMFRWRVEQPAHNYATGPSPGNYSSSSPWSSAQWTVLFNIDGSGYRSLAAHLNGSSGSPAEPIDMLAGIWSNTTNQSIDYTDPSVHLLAHNPTAFIGPTNKLMNFHNSLSPDESWPNGAAETVWDYGTTRAELITTSPCNEYFIDYQIPVAMLDATGVGGPSITRDTPISMLFCTANSLSNPFQKDCAINRQWNANAAAPAPFGDYLSFNKDEPYAQPIVSSVSATAPQSCPGTYTLTTKVQDALAVQSGVVVNTLKSVQFYYWYDKNGDGQATAADTGSVWTRITPNATLTANTLNTFTASWDATSLPKGKYLVGVQATDDNTALDDGMVANGIDNRTFSYLSGDAQNKIYIAGSWQTGQQALFPTHSPAQSPSSGENWFGNPSVTGMQVALVGTAINACGVAPTLTLNSTPSSVATGGTVNFTMTVTNPAQNSSTITVSSVSDVLPNGFTYVNASSSGTGGLPSTNPSVAGQTLTWTLGSPLSLAPGASATLSFSATASSNAGSYSSTATSVTSFGDLTSSPTSIVVDSARVSLSMSPSVYSIAADGTSQLTYTLKYANDSGVIVTGASISDVVPAGVTYVTCSGGSSCGNTAGTVSWTLGTLAGGASGTATLTITVPSNYSTYSVANSATLSVTAPDSSTVTASASATVAVTGVGGSTSPAFTLTNTASVASVAPGGSVTYTLTYNNYGTGAATSVVLTDTLPAGMSFSSCTGSCSQSGGTATWNLGTIAAGASGTVTITLTAASPFTAVNPTTNSASITWTGGTPVVATASVGVVGAGTQSCSTYYFKPTTANVGFDGTKKIANVSPVPQASDTGSKASATVTSSGYTEMLRFYQDPQTSNDVPFSGNLTTNVYIDRNNGQGLSIRTTVYDYNSTSGATSSLGQNVTSFTGSTKGLLTFTLPLSGTLSKDHRLLWVYEATASNNPVPVEFQYGGTVSNGYSSGTTFANSNASYCVTPPAQLTLTNQASSASIAEGATPVLTYTLKYANIGSASATNSTLIAALPTGFTGCEYSTDGVNFAGNTCSSVGGTPPSHSFSLGTLAGGASGTRYVRGTVPSGTTGGGTLTSTSTISSDQTSALNASATTQVTSSGIPGGTPALTLLLSANRSTATPGAAVIYTLTVINTGSAAATNVVVSNTVPSSAYYSYSGCTAGCGAVGSALTWPTIASLAAGASQSFTYTMTVGTSALPAGVTVVADDAAASGGGGLNATSNAVNVAVNGNPSLVLLNNATPSSGLQPGNTITYTLSLANSGAADASTAQVTFPIPSNTAFSGNITASQGTGSFDTVGNRVVFDIGTLASGATATLTFDVTINTPLPSGNTTIIGTATASSGNASGQVASATASASAAPVLTLSKVAPTSVALPSAVLTAAANGTTLLVDRTDRLQLNQLVKVGSQVARIVGLSAKSVLVNAPITASSGATVNGALTFTLAYGNTGNAAATAVVVREPLASGFAYYASSPAASSAPSAGSNGNVDWNLGTLAANAGGTVQVIAFPSGSTGNFTDISQISSSNASTVTASSSTQIGGLTIAKSSSTPVVSAGSSATYTILLTNSLGSPVTPVTITDKLPQGFTYHASSATVGGIAVEPTFDVADTAHTEPSWGGLSVPATGSLTIVFQADISGATGAGGYQNEVAADVPGGIGVIDFDPLLTTAEDVRVLAAATGIAKGYVFKRTSGNALSFDPLTDTPLSGVRVEIHKSGADCNNPVGGNCVVVYTDSDGYYEHAMAAEPWIVSVKQNTGDLPTGWVQVAGTNDNTVNVPDQSSVTEYDGFASSAPPTHDITTSAGAHGTINPTSKTVNDGDVTTFTITPDVGYFINTVSGCGGSLSSNTYTTGVVTADCTVTASFTAAPPVTHTVSTSAGANGAIAPTSATVNDGNTTSFTVTPDAGFTISTATGCNGSLSGNTYTTGAITADCTVSATFGVIGVPNHTVSATAGAGGSINPPSASVADGATTSFSVTPNAGFTIGSVIGCSGGLVGNTYTTGAITSDCAVVASFNAIPPSTYTVNGTAGSGGGISPTSVQVASGTTTSFTLTPNTGYHVAGASGCAGSRSGNTFTTGAIVGACTVNVTFAIDQHVVTATAGTGGSVSPGSTTVNHGATAVFTVTPNQSYGVDTVSGCGGSLSGNTYTTAAVTSACSVTATFLVNAPLFGPAPPVSINARSLFTDVPLNIAPQATDGSGNPLKVTLVGPTKLRPGRHTLTWSATDAQGRTLTTTQQLDIWPTISVSEDLIVGFGNSGDFDVVLNGDAPVYPFSVAFTVGGDGGLGTLHTLAPGTATFASGTETSVHFDALPQGTSMPTRHLIVTLDPTANVGERGSLQISLVSENIAPRAQIIVSQGGRTGALVARDGGSITLHVAIDDANPRDTHTVEWTYPRNASVQSSSNGRDLALDPASLAAGLHEFVASVTDSGTPALSTKARVMLALISASPQLGSGDTNGNGVPDSTEGWGDSGNGIPTYMDRGTPKYVLPEDAPVIDRYLIEGDPGVQLRIGPYAQFSTGGGARLPNATVTQLIGNDVVTNVGGYFDLDAFDLPIAGEAVRAVIPQRQPIPSQPVYRLWDPAQGKWYTFVEDGGNRLSSAPGEAGFCPPAGSTAYTPGLTAGNWCVQITVVEGGANDADHQKNATLSITGGIGQRENSIVTGSSSGGGGAMGGLSIILGALALLRRARRMWRRIAILTCMLPVMSYAAEERRCDLQPVHCFYVGLDAALVHNSKGASDMDARLADQGYTTQTSLSGQSRVGGDLFVGYRWKRVAAELGYANLGRMDTVIAGNTPVDDAYLRAISLAHPRSGEGPSISGVAFLKMREPWELFGRAGLFYWKNTLSAEGFGRFSDAEDRKLDPFVGLGAKRERADKKWSAQAELRFYRLDGEMLTSFELGLRYRLPW